MSYVRRYDYQCETNISCDPITVKLKKGFYTFEVFGAKGGTQFINDLAIEGGKGGYAKMSYYIKDPINVYLYIGGSGSYSDVFFEKGGWNGGGNGADSGASGGGATDIRLIPGNWDDEASLKSRIIVAGGGAGGYAGVGCRATGGNGGGEKGTTRTVILGDCKVDEVCIADHSGCTGGADRSKKGTFGKGKSSL